MFDGERAGTFLCMHSLQEGVLVGKNAFLKGAFFEGFLLLFSDVRLNQSSPLRSIHTSL